MLFYYVSTNRECDEYVFAIVPSAWMVWWISIFPYNPLVLGSNPTEPHFCRILPHPSHVPDVSPCCPRLRLPARPLGCRTVRLRMVQHHYHTSHHLSERRHRSSDPRTPLPGIPRPFPHAPDRVLSCPITGRSPASQFDVVPLM